MSADSLPYVLRELICLYCLLILLNIEFILYDEFD